MLLVLLDMAWGFLLRVAPVSASTPVRGVREDMLKFRSGVTLGCAVRSGAPVTWVFSLYVVQVGSACPR